MSYQREFERHLSIGVIGAGGHCYRNLLPAFHYLPVRVAAFCDPNVELSKKTSPEYGDTPFFTTLEEMLDKVKLDAVVMAVSPKLHPILTLKCLARGVHVWMEKPPATRAEDVRKMIAARGDLVVEVGFKKAFMPCLIKMQEILQRPASGLLRSISGSYSVELPADGAAALEPDFKGYNNWLANGCHPLSAFLAVGGAVSSILATNGEHGGGACLMRFRNGSFGNLHFASGMRGPCENYDAFAENTHVSIENASRVIWHRGSPLNYSKSTTYAPPELDHGSVSWEPTFTYATLENKALFVQGMWNSLNEFCQAILEKRQPRQGTLEFALEVMKVYEAALLSRGQWLDIPQN